MADSSNSDAAERSFVGVHLKCCNAYVRLYINHAGNAYTGWCPKCATPVRVPIVSEGGSASRFFEAS